jgi:hypothetical protein
MADIVESSRVAIDTVVPTPHFVKYGGNGWAAVKGYLDAPGADVYTESTAFWVMQSVRLDLGYGSQVHP